MRSNTILLAALFAVLFSTPSFSQTELDCSTAADVVKHADQRGEELRLYDTYDDIEVVNAVLLESGWEAYVDVADTIQIFTVEPGRYMLMASIQGCHVAHAFVDDSVVARLKGTFDVSRSRVSGARAP